MFQTIKIQNQSLYSNFSYISTINTTSTLNLPSYYIAAYHKNRLFHAYVVYSYSSNQIVEVLVFYGDYHVISIPPNMIANTNYPSSSIEYPSQFVRVRVARSGRLGLMTCNIVGNDYNAYRCTLQLFVINVQSNTFTNISSIALTY